MSQLSEPVSSAQAARLRRAVLNFRNSQHRRVFPTTVHVGDPDGLNVRFVEAEHADKSHRTRTSRVRNVLDFAQRADVVGALLDRAVLASPPDRQRPMAPPMMWVSRPGDVGQVHDIDAVWLAAGRQAFAESGIPLTLIVITRSGWYDPRSGVLRRWRRLR